MLDINIERIGKIVFLSMILFMASFFVVTRPHRVKGVNAEPGNPATIISDDTYLCEISDLCVKDGYIYLLFSNKGAIKIYDENGVYIKSYIYYKTKGQSELLADDDNVYLFDERHNQYIFCLGELVGYKQLDYHSYCNMIETLESKNESQEPVGGHYYQKYASVYREQNDGTHIKVIARPFAAVMYNEVVALIVLSLQMLLCFICLFMKNGHHLTQ